VGRAGRDAVELGRFGPKFEGGIQGADLALAADVTAIIAYNDLMALGALARLADRDVPVPDGMSVVGFDNLLYAAVCAPPLTTVAMPMEAGGRAAVDLLLAGIGGAEDGTGNRELTTNLIVRATTAAVSTTGNGPHRSDSVPQAMLQHAIARKPIVIALDTPATDQPVSRTIG